MPDETDGELALRARDVDSNTMAALARPQSWFLTAGDGDVGVDLGVPRAELTSVSPWEQRERLAPRAVS